MSPYFISTVVVTVLLLCSSGVASGADDEGFDEEVLVVAPTPSGAAGLAADKLPFNVQSATADSLARSQALDLTDFMNTQLASVNINSAQNNPLQPDVQYRGFAASPLLGLSQGVAVYQNGARVNEALGDAVNWDLIPASAIHRLSLVGGSNPLFGLNTLGGAITVEMKNGFNFEHTQMEVSGGAWARLGTHVERGENNGRFGYYVNASYFEEDGWRDLSPSKALNVFSSASYRGERSSADISYQYGNTDLTGNGAVPLGLMQIDRDAVFTAPDITENELHMINTRAAFDFNDQTSFNVQGFYRVNTTDSFNGDGSEFGACTLDGQALLVEGLEEDDIDELGLDADEVCAANPFAASDVDALEDALNALAGDDEFELDAIESLSGSGRLSDEAINNLSERTQRSYGADAQFNFKRAIFSRPNQLVAGLSYFRATARFNATTELAELDPVTRSTIGLGVGTFVDEFATRVNTHATTWSVYFSDSLDLTDRLTLTFSGRYNDTDVVLRDRSQQRPELNGNHHFGRFNPAAGFSFDLTDAHNVYAGYSESSRAPTPIELACNEGVFDIARANAVAAGEDPDDVNFECRLPNAFLADPPLEQVVAETVEFGVRGDVLGVRHRLGYFRTTSSNDIIFQTTGRGTGLFANVNKTRRQGFESSFNGHLGALEWSTSYSLIVATFEDNFMALSPDHPGANDDGEIEVRPGDRIPGIPAHQFKFSGDYTFFDQLQVGMDVTFNSGQVLRGDEANLLTRTDGYAVVNLRGSYRATEALEFFARVTNLFDTNYENFGLVGEEPGEILPDLSNQSPLFFGVGAPVAGWIGARLQF